jgi:hypothetical protein
MNKIEILKIINSKVYEGLYSFEDVEQDLDDSIDAINESLNTKFPYFSEKLTTDSAEYTYDLNGTEVPIFPEKYIRSVCINYVIMEKMREEDEFGMLFQTANQKYLAGIDTMFRDFYNRVPEIFQDTEGGYLELDGEKPEEVSISIPWGVDD